MTKAGHEAWLEDAKRASQCPGPPLTVPALAARLVHLDQLMRSAPPGLLNAYVRLKEDNLADRMEVRVAELELERWAWTVSTAPDPMRMLLPLAVEIRATDALLHRIRPREEPLDPMAEWRAEGLETFVIPAQRRRVGRGAPRDRHPYYRRGVLKHRLVPARVGDFTVRLKRGRSSASQASVEFRGGAALFANITTFRVDRSRDAGLFTVTACRANDHGDQIEQGLRRAHEEACTTLVWPELTISSGDRSSIQRWLATRLLSDLFHSPRLEMIVAGSWHQGTAGETVNRAYVFDGLGDQLLTFDKLFRFHDPDYGTEDIVESEVIEVLVLDDRLVTFGICRDFAEIAPHNPFSSLDVDLIIVPSMGNLRTAQGHRLTAELVRVRTAARSFVVQQHDPDRPNATAPSEGVGFVVHDEKIIRQSTVFASYHVSNPDDTDPKSE